MTMINMKVNMKTTMKRVIALLVFLGVGAFTASAHADFDNFDTHNATTCIIKGHSESDLKEALKQYKKSDNRLCTWEIQFKDNYHM